MTDVAAAVEAAADTTAASEQADDTEAKARAKGWRPKDEYSGKPDNWKDPEAYLEHDDLKSRLAKAEDRLSRVSKTTEKALEQIKRQHEKEMAQLKAQKAAAVKAGNVDAVEKIDEAIDTLKESKPEKADDAVEDKAEVTADWLVDNAWYESDEAMTRYAATISNGYAEQNPKASMKENLAHVDKKMRAKFPDYDFGSKKPATTTKPAGANGHAPVDGGGAFPGLNKKTGKTASDLPPEAKDVGALLVKDGLYKDMNDYAKKYFAEEKRDA